MNKFLAIALSISILAGACKKEKDEAIPKVVPTLKAITLSDLNDTLSLSFSEKIYANAAATGIPEATVFSFTTSDLVNIDMNATKVIRSETDENELQVIIKYTGHAFGGEEITLHFNSEVYSASGGAIDLTTSQTFTLNNRGIIGNWSAFDISDRLESLNYDPTLTVEFNTDYSYTISGSVSGEAFTKKGWFTQTETIFGTIWEIGMLQTEYNNGPDHVSYKGIFSVKNNDGIPTLWLEYVQTDPEISGLTQPSAEDSFGSTSDGAYGLYNVQKYNKTSK